ncbi:MAG: hypothetical protein BWY78_00585 [Alphaproteobacteria bacterium ADurb.Bin438]|nr:MAG: hypothetical protein BWY78_00585 [Alphaproteobacteria bacterium ADurb.Bin438]
MNTDELFKNWEDCKQKNPDMIDFFNDTEEEIIEELYQAKDIITYDDKKIKDVIKGKKLDDVKRDIIREVGDSCVYDVEIKTNDKGETLCSVNIDNVGLFVGIIMFNLISLYHSLCVEHKNLVLDITFERKEWQKIFEDGELFDILYDIFENEGIEIDANVKKKDNKKGGK